MFFMKGMACSAALWMFLFARYGAGECQKCCARHVPGKKKMKKSSVVLNIVAAVVLNILTILSTILMGYHVQINGLVRGKRNAHDCACALGGCHRL